MKLLFCQRNETFPWLPSLLSQKSIFPLENTCVKCSAKNKMMLEHCARGLAVLLLCPDEEWQPGRRGTAVGYSSSCLLDVHRHAFSWWFLMARLEVFSFQKMTLQSPAPFSIFTSNFVTGIENTLIRFTDNSNMGQAAPCWTITEYKIFSKNWRHVLKKGRMKISTDKFKVPHEGKERHAEEEALFWVEKGG